MSTIAFFCAVLVFCLAAAGGFLGLETQWLQFVVFYLLLSAIYGKLSEITEILSDLQSIKK